MKRLPAPEVQQIILNIIEAARAEYEPTSESIVGRFARDIAGQYFYLHNRSLVSTDEKIKAELHENRETQEGLFIDALASDNEAHCNHFGSFQNDRFYWFASISFIDFVLNNCFSVLTPPATDEPNPATTYHNIKEVCRLLFYDRIKWIGNQEQKKPLKEFFSPQVVEFLGDDAGNWRTIQNQLKRELERRVADSRDIALVNALARDIVEFMCSVTTMYRDNFSLLGVFETYNDHYNSRIDRINEINAKKERKDNTLFVTDFNTIGAVRDALYGWATILISYVRRYSPDIYREYEPVFRSAIDYNVPEMATAPATPTPPATDEQVKLTHPQIAILHHIIGHPINENNGGDIARKYGQTSGKRLANTYKALTSELHRTANAKYTVKNYEKILPLLNGKYKEQAERELRNARKNNEKY